MSRHIGMKWNGDSFFFAVFVDLVTPTLPDEREVALSSARITSAAVIRGSLSVTPPLPTKSG